MKVREAARGGYEGGGGNMRRLFIMGNDDPILDAEVVGMPCQTCGGIGNHEGDCNACGTSGLVDGKPCANCGETGRGPWVPCPDCPPPVVIVPEAMARAKRVMFEALGGVGYSPEHDPDTNMTEEDYERALHAVLQALLPDARVAKEVGGFDGGGFYLRWKSGVRTFMRPRAGDDIAILATQAREEEGNE